MIRYDRETNRISLDTAHSSLQFAVREGLLLQTYSGPRLRGWAAEERAPHNDPGCWPNLLPQVCAVPGAGDQRTCALQAEFSDGSEIILDLRKTGAAQEFVFEEKNICWLELKKLIKSEEPSPFPALVQIEVYGTEG